MSRIFFFRQLIRYINLFISQLAKLPVFRSSESLDKSIINSLHLEIPMIFYSRHPLFNRLDHLVRDFFLSYFQKREHLLHIKINQNSPVLKQDSISSGLSISRNFLPIYYNIVNWFEFRYQ